jgi:polysaccharide pyruvyl transferase WcaK-like protein
MIAPPAPGGATTCLRIAPDVAGGVHALLGGHARGLASIVDASRHARRQGPVEWRVEVTPTSVHSIEAIQRLAEEEGVAIRFEVTQPLTEPDQAFLDDHLAHRGPHQRRGRGLDTTGRDLLAMAGDAAAALRRAATPTRGPTPPTTALPRIVAIGAYGGDHIGDAAILGGVLLTLHRRHGTASATVCSHRPEHTRRLVAGLELPVHLSVEPYEARRVDGLLDDADGLVLAGGPLMDLPRVLVRHLAAAHAARIRGLPFLIERVGVGPFRRRISRWAARRLLDRAQRISVRSAACASDPVLAGHHVEIGRDPAFDYLATRKTRLDPTDGERRSLTDLLAGTEGRLLVGVNLRPILHLWSPRGAEYARTTEDAFIGDFAETLVRFAAASSRPVTFVFFPMNAVHFGMSDLAAAYRLHRGVGARADLRVWEIDPTVDGALSLLRRLDLAITMRLHACIFALSQGLGVVGLDYYPGQGGKVEQLFTEAGRSEDVRRIDTFQPEWLIDRLSAMRDALVPASTPRPC